MRKDQWKLYIKHLQKTIEGQTIPPKDRARLSKDAATCFFIH